MIKYEGTIDMTKEELQDYIINIIVTYYIEENERLKRTIKSLLKEKRKSK